MALAKRPSSGLEYPDDGTSVTASGTSQTERGNLGQFRRQPRGSSVSHASVNQFNSSGIAHRQAVHPFD